jgi:hypothetical protein
MGLVLLFNQGNEKSNFLIHVRKGKNHEQKNIFNQSFSHPDHPDTGKSLSVSPHHSNHLSKDRK